jgi:S1-C subfamily serine protease
MAGTFGALVSKGQKRYILSNNHVIADENKLALGSSIFQPGFLDAGAPPNNRAIAGLGKFVALVFGGGTNKVDCAMAEVSLTL